MQQLLGDEYAAFAASYAQPPLVGLRVNTLKITPADFSNISPFALEAAGAYAPAGFLVVDGSKPGSHPYHAAGLYYLQEPSAMAVAEMVQPQPGELVLDMAAAPGGKATHLSALMGDAGLLVANDIDAGRAAILAENLERWGARNALVTNAHPAQLARQFGPVFDRVLVDAPCSGEGMFRRMGAFAWSQANVLACARRQTAVLATAAGLVRPGGRLVYATCTFAPEEDEAAVAQFLAAQAQFALVEPTRHAGFERGRPLWAAAGGAADNVPDAGLEKTVRLWPHRFAGEGHFVAVMQRDKNKKPDEFADPYGAGEPFRFGKSDRLGALKSGEFALWDAFARENLQVAWPPARLRLWQRRLYLLPETAVSTGNLKLVRYGLLLGEIGKNHFKPAHALALALKPGEARTAVDFPPDAPEVSAYLCGHPLPHPDRLHSDMTDHGLPLTNNWILLTIDGFPLGWAKASGGQLKNHYPRGLRQKRTGL